MDIITTAHLTKYYGKSRGIIDLSLNVRKGEFFGFIGPNGAGKSTTIRILLGLIHASSGSASVLGMDISARRRKILENIGYIPSEAMFYHSTTVAELLRLSANLRRKDCSEEARRLCERLQLDPAQKTDSLSLGSRKKVSIACALQHRPDLYIFDEPTSGLDPLIQKEFFDLLRERNAQGATIFLSSHILSEVQKYCSRAAVIREGQIAACGDIAQLSQTEKNDAAKGKIFTKIGRELAVAVKEGGGADPANNSRLRDVIAKAKSNNMPNDTIERNIKKAAGEGSADNYEHITYEGYGPNGTAIIVKTMTDNKNRTASNVRNAFTKGSGNVGTPGCVSFMFDEKGQIFVAKEDCSMDADELMMLALDAGAEDFSEDEESFEILTDPDSFSDVRLKLEEAGIAMASAEVTMIPQTYVELTNEEDIKNIQKTLDLLEEDDDVQDVYHNWNE